MTDRNPRPIWKGFHRKSRSDAPPAIPAISRELLEEDKVSYPPDNPDRGNGSGCWTPAGLHAGGMPRASLRYEASISLGSAAYRIPMRHAGNSSLKTWMTASKAGADTSIQSEVSAMTLLTFRGAPISPPEEASGYVAKTVVLAPCAPVRSPRGKRGTCLGSE